MTLAKVAHVICCNDSVQAVWVGTEKQAKKLLRRLSANDKARWLYNHGIGVRYEDICRWHIRAVPAYSYLIGWSFLDSTEIKE